MSKEKKKRRILNDNDKCEIISSSISKLIASSENSDFVNDCRRILQTENIDQMKNKLKNKFLDIATDKKLENSSLLNKQELDDSLDSFLQNAENILSYEDELAGFTDWKQL